MGFDKLSAPLAGQPVLWHSLRAFSACPEIGHLIVVTSADRMDAIREMADTLPEGKPLDLVEGGAERHLSVWNGLQTLPDATKYVAIHDGARPLITVQAIELCLAAAREHGAASLAHRVADTLKRADAEGCVTGSVDRAGLWAMETPQTFRRHLILRAYEKVLAENLHVTDEVSTLQLLGEPVHLVENPTPNLKITFPQDLDTATALLNQTDQS